jgi:hypothetical protein
MFKSAGYDSSSRITLGTQQHRSLLYAPLIIRSGPS